MLVVTTAPYVSLTNALVHNARETLAFIKAERAAQLEVNKRSIIEQIEHLRSLANVLPSDASKGEQIRNATLWVGSEPQDMRRLAVTFGSAEGEMASEAARHLATLSELAQRVQTTPRTTGFDWNKFPWERWHEARQGAERCLQSLKGYIERPW